MSQEHQLTGRAALFHGPGKPIELREFPVASPSRGDFLVRIRRTNICGSDLHAWSGHFDIPSLGGQLPTILGHEACAEIVELGAERQTDSAGAVLQPGDRVVFSHFTVCGACYYCLMGKSEACQKRWMAMTSCATEAPHFVGMFADYYYVREGSIVLRVPDDLPDSVVVGANCAVAQIVFAFDQAGIRAGHSVIIQGAGGLGLYAAAIARERGASPIIVVDRVPERLALALEFGANEIIDMNKHQSAKERIRLVRGLTGGYGADVAVELAGAEAISEGMSYIAPTGTYILIGSVAAGQRVDLDPARIVLRNMRMIGSCYYRPYALKEAVSFLSRNRVRVPFEKMNAQTYGLEDINVAFSDANGKRVATRPSLVMT